MFDKVNGNAASHAIASHSMPPANVRCRSSLPYTSSTLSIAIDCCSRNRSANVNTDRLRAHMANRFCRLQLLFKYSVLIILTITSLFIALAKCEQSVSTSPQLMSVGAIRSYAAPHNGHTDNIYANTDYSSSISKNNITAVERRGQGKRQRQRQRQGQQPRQRQQRQQQTQQQLQPSSKQGNKYGNTFPLNNMNREFLLQRKVTDSTSAALPSRSLVQPKNICQDYCICEPGIRSIKINCDLRTLSHKRVVFDAGFQLPANTRSISIRLGPSAHFILEHGFFKNNSVNSFSIEGTLNENQQVEITTNAFLGNDGQYPEVWINDISTIFIRAEAFSKIVKLVVRNCNELTLFSNAFKNVEANAEFSNIEAFTINEKVLNSGKAKLLIQNSNLENLHRFAGFLSEIRFVNCSIGNINTGTFDVHKINAIIFEGCRINTIKPKAITEKLQSNRISITDAVIGYIENEAIYGSGIAEFTLMRNKIDTINERAIYATAINTVISQNEILHLGENWLHIKEWSNVTIEKNSFGVFGAMLLDPVKKGVTCRFDSNYVSEPLPGSLNITNNYCMIREISVNISCRCNLDWLEKLSSHDLRSETFCRIDNLVHCFNSTTINTVKYLNEVCNEKTDIIKCGPNKRLIKDRGRFFTQEELEANEKSKNKIIFIAVGSAALIILVTMMVCVAWRCRNKNGNNVDSEHLHNFSNNDLHIIEQTMQIVKKKYPDHYRKISTQMHILLKSDLSNTKCVKTVSQIVDLTGKIPNPENDFVSLNRVLSQHLQPQMPPPSAPISITSSDPIYSEPSLGGLDGGFYTSSTIVPLPTNPATNDTAITSPEHIYAELNSAQQPLLRNEYASPADRNIDSLDLYTEPINERGFSDAFVLMTQQPISQYAIPSTSKSQQPKNAHAYPHLHNLNQRSCEQATISSSKLAAEHNNAHLSSDRRFQLNLRRAYDGSQQLNAPVVYTTPDPNRKRTQKPTNSTEQTATAPTAAAAAAAAVALPDQAQPDAGSNHSGGSNETVKIDDIIEYADA